MSPIELDAWLSARRTEVERAVARLCSAGQAPGRLGAAAAYALEGRGKRLRPVLVVACCEAADPGGTDSPRRRAASLVPAVAVELIHTYSLVHDDLPCMDDDDFRRGRPSTHRAFGEAAAVLAGDALLTEAFRVIADPRGWPPGTPASLQRDVALHLAEAAGHRGMVGGQAVDVGLAGPVADADSLDALHRGKTGALFVFACVAGGLCAEAGAAEVDRLRVFGDRVGLAFQIADDLLDASQDGHSPGEAAGPPSYPALLGVAAARTRAAQLADEAREAAESLGPAAAPLAALARYAVQRDR